MTKIYLKTYGCAANQARGEKLTNKLLCAGYTQSKQIDADVIILNTCSLKTPTENKMFRFIQENSNKNIIVAGCFPLSYPNDEKLKNCSLVGTYNFNNIVEAVEKTLAGEKVRLLSKQKDFLNCAPVRDNEQIAKIIIGTGCLGNCAYCAGKLAHGELKSKPVNSILNEVSLALEAQCKEIWICSQDNGCYGFDIGTNLIALLTRIIKLKGNFKVRIGMMNPEYGLQFLPKLIEILQHKKIYKFIHLPVQSGDNKILKAMFRRYTAEEFKHLVQELRKSIPHLTLATDIIVGLPNEDKISFENTIKLITETKPEVLNLSRYWLRKNTIAATLSPMHPKKSKELSRKLDKIYKQIALNTNKKNIGKIFDVLFTQKGSQANQYRGRTNAYRPVLTETKENLLGKIKKVRIVSASKDCLFGETV